METQFCIMLLLFIFYNFNLIISRRKVSKMNHKLVNQRKSNSAKHLEPLPGQSLISYLLATGFCLWSTPQAIIQNVICKLLAVNQFRSTKIQMLIDTFFALLKLYIQLEPVHATFDFLKCLDQFFSDLIENVVQINHLWYTSIQK